MDSLPACTLIVILGSVGLRSRRWSLSGSTTIRPKRLQARYSEYRYASRFWLRARHYSIDATVTDFGGIFITNIPP